MHTSLPTIINSNYRAQKEDLTTTRHVCSLRKTMLNEQLYTADGHKIITKLNIPWERMLLLKLALVQLSLEV